MKCSIGGEPDMWNDAKADAGLDDAQAVVRRPSWHKGRPIPFLQILRVDASDIGGMAQRQRV